MDRFLKRYEKPAVPAKNIYHGNALEMRTNVGTLPNLEPDFALLSGF